MVRESIEKTLNKTLLHILSRTIWTIVVLYAVLMAVIHLPSVQAFIASGLKEKIEERIGTRVEIEKVNLGFLNRIIVDGFEVYDQNKERFLKSSRVSVKIDLIDLMSGKINLTSAQLFGLDANIYKNTPNDKLNFQFIVDSLASKDTTSNTPLNLQISSLVIRNGAVKYNLRYLPQKNEKLDINHLSISKLSTHIMLYELTDETIDINVKHLSFFEKSGLEVKDIQFHAKADAHKAGITNLKIALPHSEINIPKLRADYRFNNGKIVEEALKFDTDIEIPRFRFSDIASLLPFETKKLPELSANVSLNGEKGNANFKTSVKATDNSIELDAEGKAESFLTDLKWRIEPLSLYVSSALFETLNKITPMPSQVMGLGDIALNGTAYGTKSLIAFNQDITTDKCGAITVTGEFDGKELDTHIKTNDLVLGQILGNPEIGIIAADASADVILKEGRISSFKLDGLIPQFQYKNYTYQNMEVSGEYSNGNVNGKFSIDDPNVLMTANAKVKLSGKVKDIDADIELEHFCPKQLGLTDKWNDGVFSLHCNTNLHGSSIDDIVGYVDLSNLSMIGGNVKEGAMPENLYVQNIHISSTLNNNSERQITLEGDDAKLLVKGDFTPSQLQNTIIGLVHAQLPSLSVNTTNQSYAGNVIIDGQMLSTEWLRKLVGVDIDLHRPATFQGYINGYTKQANLFLDIPSINAFEHELENVQLLLWTPEEGLCGSISMQMPDKDTDKEPFSVALEAKAYNDIVNATIAWNNNRDNIFRGRLNLKSNFTPSPLGATNAHISIDRSDIQVGDSIWRMHSRDIVYTDNRLSIDHFAFENDFQHIYVNGVASKSSSDYLMADLKNVNVSYILNLVNFHSVEFGGFASGHIAGHSILEAPEASGHIDVAGFTFQEGRMGNLHIDAQLNNSKKQIDIDAYAEDDDRTLLNIGGFVSPHREEIDLDIQAHNEHLDFMHYFCHSFMDEVNGTCTGRLHLFGPFSGVNLEGDMLINGAVNITSLNCRYAFHDATVHFIPNEIYIEKQPIYDKYGNIAYFSGGLHHKCLSRMTYDFVIDAEKLLCYDFHDFGEMNFYGTAFMTGKCKITGRSSELLFDVNGNVEPGSSLVYNATSPDAITRSEFINWKSVNKKQQKNNSEKNTDDEEEEKELKDVSTNMRMNFLVNVTPAATLRILMDRNTGDYIDLHGSGVLRANYYNKGDFDLYGNYLINDGIYKMTIQNVINRKFDFLSGSSIAFSGNPYSAVLNMQAKYTVNSVSLSDLNIGNSFSSNNIKVDCLMDITGTPAAPIVNFNLDPHTNNAEARQMIFSLINSEEELNQQVLYLLSVGRFYAQGNNNANVQDNRVGQTSLAMQSIVSGTLSQQFNNILNKMVKNNNWNFGANISPGDEGFYNAEYEGMLNGSMLNNRLLFNGQFGYRDNANTANQEFIGDFDLRYLLFPNGNLAVRVYNQTNDRYFTKNSLNTQGLGLILKYDFDTFRALFRRKKKQ